jgi:hypothetical protein
MTTRKDIALWDKELHALATNFGDGDKTEWLMEYSGLKQRILDRCSLGRYSNGLSMSDSIIKDFNGYEYLAILFAKMKVLDDAVKGFIEEED